MGNFTLNVQQYSFGRTQIFALYFTCDNWDINYQNNIWDTVRCMIFPNVQISRVQLKRVNKKQLN